MYSGGAGRGDGVAGVGVAGGAGMLYGATVGAGSGGGLRLGAAAKVCEAAGRRRGGRAERGGVKQLWRCFSIGMWVHTACVSGRAVLYST